MIKDNEDNGLLILATTILDLVTLSYLFGNKKENKPSFEVENKGFIDDKENIKKDFSNIFQKKVHNKEN